MHSEANPRKVLSQSLIGLRPFHIGMLMTSCGTRRHSFPIVLYKLRYVALFSEILAGRYSA